MLRMRADQPASGVPCRGYFGRPPATVRLMRDRAGRGRGAGGGARLRRLRSTYDIGRWWADAGGRGWSAAVAAAILVHIRFGFTSLASAAVARRHITMGVVSISWCIVEALRLGMRRAHGQAPSLSLWIFDFARLPARPPFYRGFSGRADRGWMAPAAHGRPCHRRGGVIKEDLPCYSLTTTGARPMTWPSSLSLHHESRGPSRSCVAPIACPRRPTMLG